MNSTDKENLDYEYHVGPVEGSGTITMNLKLGDPYLDSHPKSYYVHNSDELTEYFTVYPDGLVFFFHKTTTQIDVYTNREFELKDNGDFVLVSR